MGGDRLLDPLRRSAAARRPDGRPARPPAAVHGRAGALHRQLPPRRPRVVRGLADRLPRAAGPRRGAGLAGRAFDPHDDLRRGSRAQPRARHLGRGLRQRRRRRRAARRRADERAELVVGLLHQRAGRPGRDRADPAPAKREPRRPRPSPLRPPRRRVDHRRPDAARLRDDARRPARLGRHRDGRPARRVRRADRRVRRDRAAVGGPAASDADVPPADARPGRTSPGS